MESHDNLKQLRQLNEEIHRIFLHELVPPDDWYEERADTLHLYAELDWIPYATRFYGKNDELHQLAVQIHTDLFYVLEEWSTSPHFSLVPYRRIIENIQTFWDTYSRLYVGDERDEEVIDLIEQMTHM